MPTIIATAALGTVLFSLVLHGAQSTTTSRRERAATAYQHAQRLRVALETHPGQPIASYLRVVRAFQLVYRTDPAYLKTPAALAAAAEVYQEMGRQFTSDRYYSKAVEAYQFLAAQYPGTSLATDALFTAAEIYRADIENPLEASAAYKEFLKIYPHSARAPKARQELAKMNRELAQWPSGVSVASASLSPTEEEPEARDAFHKRPQNVNELGPVNTGSISNSNSGPNSGPSSGELLEVESIRHWIGPNYTRVVIRVGGQTKFNAIHLENPPRLVFDLAGTRLSPELARKVFQVQNGFLKSIRVAQFQPTVTRIVLDVPRIENYSVFSLPDPFRLVIDIHGAPKALEARAAKPSSAADLPPSDSATPSPSGPFSQPRFQRATGSDVNGTESEARSEPLRSAPGAGSAARLSDNTTGSASLPATSPAGDSLAAQLSGASPTLTRALGLKIRRIVIDAGHGGHDTGTIGPTGLEEKNVVLDVALRLRKLVERRMGCEVIMTRSTDTFIPLEERTAIANEYGADLFISIHANASHDPSARGIEIYYLNFTSDPEALQLAARENATSRSSVYQLQNLIKKIALSEKIGESSQFAKIVDTQLVNRLDKDGDFEKNRGVKKAPFVVLIGANMPSILAEISFLSNPHDERMLRKASFRHKIALGLYNGIARYASSLGTIRVAQRTPLPPPLHAASAF